MDGRELTPLKAFKEAVEREIDTLKEQVDDLEREENDLQRDFSALDRGEAWKLPLVVLDVGGQVFRTTVATLTGKSGFFRELCDGLGNKKPDAKGRIFIDRSPLAFRFVLSFMRDESIATASSVEKEILLEDARFYELDELEAELSSSSQYSPSSPGYSPTSPKYCPSPPDYSNISPGVYRPYVPFSPPFHTPSPRHHDSPCEPLLKRARQDVEERRTQYETLVRIAHKINTVVSNECIRLKLSQNDAEFTTLCKTLVSGGGMLAAKFNGGGADRWKADVLEDGCVFIDRNAENFQYILNVLRGYPIPKNLSHNQKVSLEADLEYFGIVIE